MRTPEQFTEEMAIINPSIEVLGKYTKAVESVLVKCKICGKEWSPKAYSLLQGKGCPHCSAIRGAKNNQGKTRLKNQKKFEKDLYKLNDQVHIIGEYKNCHNSIDCECKICGHKWSAKPYSLLQGHGCPRCTKSGTSFMEQLIYLSFVDIFGKENVISRDKSIIGMELDIVLPKYKVAIEPGNWNLHKKNFDRDKEKRIRCNNKGYKLITIYDKYPANLSAPFEDNCFMFADDLNKMDHLIIQRLILKLIESIDSDVCTSDLDWVVLEKLAYNNSKSKNHNDFVIEMKRINPSIDIIGKYQNSNLRIKVRCNKCGFEWEAIPSCLLAGDGCRRCGTKKAHEKFIKDQDVFIEEVKKINPNVEIIGKYTGRHKPIKAKCRICGYEWEPIAASILRGSNHKGAKTIHSKMQIR